VNELTVRDFTQADEPFALFSAWFADAEKSEPNDPNAMALATSDSAGMPNVRMVLLKDMDPHGFVFYSNAESDKGVELAGNMQAAALFHWKSLRRQIRIRGLVEEVGAEASDAYFRSRALQSRIGAWASQQSRPLESRFALEKAVAKYTAKFALGEVARHTMQNVTVDRVLTRAEMLCESKLAEIVSGLTPPDPAQGTLVDDRQE